MENLVPAKSLQSAVSDSVTLWTVARLLCPWDSPGKNTGADCQALLQGIFPTQGSKLCVLCLLLWPGLSPGDLPNLGIEPQSPTLKVDSLRAEPPGTPLALAGGFFTTSTTWETPDLSVNPVSLTLLSSRLPNVSALPRFTVQARIQPGKWHSL